LLVFFDDAGDFIQFVPSISGIERELHGFEPELRRIAALRDVHMRRFVPISAKETDAISVNARDRWQ